MRGFRTLGLVCLAAGAGPSALAAPDLGTEQQREAGRKLYDKYCAQCHGVNGDGKGHATPRLKPEPRDFTPGKYKFRTTPSGMLPTDDDLRRVIKLGLPYTSMPAWPNFTDPQISEIISHLKTFSEDFSDAEKYADPISIPRPPPSTPESIERGRVVYDEQGCAACHGELGRGDGLSARTLTDDWGEHIRPADMTQRWTFRGGPTRQDMFRTFSTGLNGTPMPSYFDSLEVEGRWDLVNYMESLGDGDAPNYSELLLVTPVEDEIDVAAGEQAFAAAPKARFPLIGQIVEPGRNFYQSINNVDVRAVYNSQEIAFLVEWHDFTMENTGSNSPTMEVPLWDEDGATDSAAGEEDEGDFWGVEEEEEPEEDFWGEEDEGDDFWGDDEGDSASGGFSDAIGVQFPSKLPTGNRKPYFIYGDSQSSVDFWFFDLVNDAGLVEQFLGRGSDALEVSESDEIEVTATYDQGRWSVIFKRPLKARGGVSLQEEMFVPIAFSAWDGYNRERGNKRALSQWFYFYLEPAEKISAVGPMARTAGVVLLVEILLVIFIRRRQAAATREAPAQGAVPQGSTS